MFFSSCPLLIQSVPNTTAELIIHLLTSYFSSKVSNGFPLIRESCSSSSLWYPGPSTHDSYCQLLFSKRTTGSPWLWVCYSTWLSALCVLLQIHIMAFSSLMESSSISLSKKLPIISPQFKFPYHLGSYLFWHLHLLSYVLIPYILYICSISSIIVYILWGLVVLFYTILQFFNKKEWMTFLKTSICLNFCILRLTM